MTQSIGTLRHIISTTDDLRLNVEEWPCSSPPPRQTCVLLHGLCDGGFVWTDIAKALAHGHHLFIPDLRGHHLSDWDPTTYTVDTLIADLLRAVQILAISDPVIVGHSLGGEVAIRFAAETGIASAVVLVDTGPNSTVNSADDLRKYLESTFRMFNSPEEYADLMEATRLFPLRSELLRLALAAVRRLDDGRYQQRADPRVVTMLDGHDESWWWPTLRKVTCPVLIVRGVASAYLSPGTAASMCRALRSGELETVSFAGHAVMSDNPNEFTDKLLRFLRRLSDGLAIHQSPKSGLPG